MLGESAILADAFRRHEEAVSKSLALLIPDIQRAAELLLQSIQEKHCLFVCGNGGSAADAQHFAAEFVCRYKEDRAAFPAIALTTDTSALTAIGNDYGFEHIFSRQIEALGREGDVLVACTTSGASKNIQAAIAQAKEQKLKVIVLTGENGKNLNRIADLVIAVPSAETARIQEVHELILHAWCEFVDAAFSAK